MYQSLLGVSVVLLAGIIFGSQQQALPEIARDHHGKATRVIFAEYPVIRTQELLSMSDLVIHARVEQQNTRLSSDSMHVYTIYELTPLRLLWLGCRGPHGDLGK